MWFKVVAGLKFYKLDLIDIYFSPNICQIEDIVSVQGYFETPRKGTKALKIMF